ncbi:hypothetical protein NDS46_18735 [Paenibacillus thiaminolyticus]|uniref:hypothetical protein n=1 Tax=Paenibacillus thiaminolyticus TaxID=49283 RepID=UPI00232BE79A|nr:hypothetical protein [Paenibacillus thiaminolyticus]WCF06384.1 hypothetical protein NDS46_18735 [Paenibacillus thiaminolyticus]
MTIRDILNPRNLMILLCAAAVVMIGFKGMHIKEKIDAVKEADRLYAAHELVEAEEAYRHARNNRSIRYEEDKLAERLRELAPITEMKRQLNEVMSEADEAAASLRFDAFLKIHSRYQQLRSTYLKSGGSYAGEFKQMLASARAADRMQEHFSRFKAHFEAQLKDGKPEGGGDESFKANLLAIPASLFGGGDQKSKQLTRLFRSYDEAQLARLAGQGEFQLMLDEVLAMRQAYRKLDIEPEWLKSKSEELAEAMLRKDVEQNNAKAFALHASAYAAYVDASGIPSRLSGYLEREMENWVRKADRHVAAGEYEAAISLYEALAGFRDMSANIDAVRITWAASDPSLLLPEGDYPLVSGGRDRFGAKVYAMAIDSERRIYYAAWDGQARPTVLRSQPLPTGNAVRSLTVEERLSSSDQPVLLVEADSHSRAALYIAYTAANNQLQPLFAFEADGYEVGGGATLLVRNPTVAGAEGRVATYEREGDSYQFVGVTPGSDYIDIRVEQLPEYPREKVRFTCEITAVSEIGAYARMGDRYILLKGDFSFEEGPVTVIGAYYYYTHLDIGSEDETAPVFMVEAVE